MREKELNNQPSIPSDKRGSFYTSGLRETFSRRNRNIPNDPRGFLLTLVGEFDRNKNETIRVYQYLDKAVPKIDMRVWKKSGKKTKHGLVLRAELAKILVGLLQKAIKDVTNG